eukprot:6856960-Pyramimonas_sp.AAC.1
MVGPPNPVQPGSVAGLWWSALAWLLTIHGTIRWTTDMVEHHGEMGLRGGIYICTHNRKDTCSATS